MTFNCPKCGAPGELFDGGIMYHCVCRLASPAPAAGLTEADIRKIVREEIKNQKSIFEQVFG